MVKNRVHACVIRRAGEIHEARQKQACQKKKPEQEKGDVRTQRTVLQQRSGGVWGGQGQRSPIRRLSGNGEFTRLLKRLVDQAVEETTTRRDKALGSCSRTQQANGEGQDGLNRKGGR